MWKIIHNEWRYFSRTRLFLGTSIGFVVLLVLTIVMGNYQTKTQQETYGEAKEHVREQWESIEAMNPHGAAHYGTYVFKPATLLSTLDEGVSSVTGNLLRVEGHVQNEMVHSEASQMQSVSRFGKLKSSLLLQYIIPLLLVFLAFNIVSSEKRSGRLKLLILQGASPFQIVFSKSLAVWLYGVFLLLFVLLVYSIINFQQMDVDTLVRMGLFFLAYALFYFVICGLTVALSARWQNPTLALTTMFGLWILWSIFLPYFFMSSVEKLYDLPSRNNFKTAMKEDRAKGIDGHNPVDKRGKALEEKVLKEYGVDSLSMLPINFDGIRMQADEEYGNQVWDKHFGNLRTVMAQQKRTYQLSGFLNPFASLQNASMGFAGSDNFHHQDFLVQVEHYRRGFIKELIDKHAFGCSKTGDWGWKADNAFFKSVADFQYQPPPIKSKFQNYIWDLALLFFWTFVTIGFLFAAIRKMRVV